MSAAGFVERRLRAAGSAGGAKAATLRTPGKKAAGRWWEIVARWLPSWGLETALAGEGYRLRMHGNSGRLD
jgi:hypothetical protein